MTTTPSPPTTPTPTNRQLRDYQARIVNNVGESNAILKMPTGSGKTIVAAELIRQSLEKYPSYRILFLVPTCELVAQQSKVLQTWAATPHVAGYTGGMADPEMAAFQVLVATPQAYLSLMVRKQYSWSWFRMVVFDEVHHVLKDHPYRSIALLLRDCHGEQVPQVLGLSASLTYQIADEAIQKTLERLCHELNIEKMESPTSQELMEGGYVAQQRGGGNIELDISIDLPEGVLPQRQRQPHLMYEVFRQRIKDGDATALALLVWQVVIGLEEYCESMFQAFSSPLEGCSKVSEWEEYAHGLAQSAGATDPILLKTFKNLEVWYVALRVLVTTWEEDEQVVLHWLRMNDAFADTHNLCEKVREAVACLQQRAANQYNFFKWSRLKHHLQDKKSRHGDRFRCLIFVQQRITSFVLAHVINKQLHDVLDLRAGFVSSRGSKITPSNKVTKSMVAETIQKFRDGEVNVLVATSVVEEGIDVPEANVVILYDSMKDSVELCQRFGRARAHESSIVILDERHDRPVELLEKVRKLQDKIVNEFDPATTGLNIGEERQRQQGREQVAYHSVLCHEKCRKSPVLALNEYKTKTKAGLTEQWSEHERSFRCTLQYKSILRTLSASAVGSSKQGTKTLCSEKLLEELKRETCT